MVATSVRRFASVARAPARAEGAAASSTMTELWHGPLTEPSDDRARSVVARRPVGLGGERVLPRVQIFTAASTGVVGASGVLPVGSMLMASAVESFTGPEKTCAAWPPPLRLLSRRTIVSPFSVHSW